MSAAPSARAVEVTAVVPAPTPDPRKKADPVNPADEIKDACDADAVEVTLADPQGPPAEGKESVTDRAKEAQSTANRLGAGVEAEVNDKGQTLSWKRGKTPKSACREKLRRLRRDYPGRVSFEPTTSERVEEVRRRRDAMIPEAMRKNAGDASYHGGFFDSYKLFGSGIVPSADGGSGGITSALTRGLTGEGGSGVAASGLGPLRSVPGPTANAPTVQLPGQYHRIVSAPPAPASYAAPTFTQRVSNAWQDTRSYVSQSIDDAGKWVSGVARSVKNSFFTGIEMIQGYGYRLVRAWRGSNWGTKPLIDGLRKIAAYMRGAGKAETDMTIGDISSAQGGKLGSHLSHGRGRDVDIGFYMTDAKTGQPVEGEFVRFTGGKDGLTGNLNGRAVRFDAARNWLLVQAIMSNQDPGFTPTNIFIADHLKRAVLAAAPASPERDGAARIMSYWPGHDNHLHLRVQ